MSFTDVRLRCLASPDRARSLLTVRAAISVASSSERPPSSRPSLMCSYWRSRLAFHARGTGAPFAGVVRGCSPVGTARHRRRGLLEEQGHQGGEISGGRRRSEAALVVDGPYLPRRERLGEVTGGRTQIVAAGERVAEPGHPGGEM